MKSNRLQTTLRLPKNLDEQLSKISMEMGISKNSLIVFLLTESLPKFSSQKNAHKKYTANFAVNQDGLNSDTDDISEINTAKNTLQKMQCKKYSVNFAVKENEQEPGNPVDSCSQSTLQNQKSKTHNCFNNIVNNNNIVIKDVINNVCSYTTTNKTEQPNKKEMIAELTRMYREATGSSSEDDYKYIGRLCREYDSHLIAKGIEELKSGLLERKIDNPRGYLRGILKNLQLPASSPANNTDNTACAPVNTNTGGERQSEAKIIDWSEDFLRRAKNGKYAQFYEWG